MTRRSWHIAVEGPVLTLSRPGRDRFDIVASAHLPDGSRRRVAHQIRQDLWRELQNQRGFSPVVQVTRASDGLHVVAGGACARPSPDTAARVAALLADPIRRARWIANSRHRRASA